jgi:hypothetical protein
MKRKDRKPFSNELGITVGQLEGWLTQFDTRARVWVMTGPGISSEAVEAWPMGNGDACIGPRKEEMDDKPGR